MIFIGWVLGFLAAMGVFAACFTAGWVQVACWISVVVLCVTMWIAVWATRRVKRY